VIVLGIGFVAGAIGVPITGALADASGFQAAIQAQVLLVVATIALAWLLPSEAYLEALTRRNSASTAVVKLDTTS
jgi:hypothetical protein